MATSKQRAVDLLTSTFDLSHRKKYTVKGEDGESLLDLYFRPITRSDRKRAQEAAGTEEALEISTQMLIQVAELEDGTKAFQAGDAIKLQRELPESVLNEIELFLFGLGGDVDLKEAKKG
tara:strand:- start:133 stop:492 length:360 start_codon:yes stop_codon:yes gene_type:complete